MVMVIQYCSYLHFVIEDFWLSGLWAGYEVFVQNAEDVWADVTELFLHLAAVCPNHVKFIFRSLKQTATL